MIKDPLIFLEHIRESIDLIEQYLENKDKEDFLEKTELQDALVRRLEIIGEATKNIQEDFKQNYPEIPWTEIAGTRDKLTHHYFGINLETVWKIIEGDLPELKEQINKILEGSK